MSQTDKKILADTIDSSFVHHNEFGDIVSQCRDLLFSNSDFVVSYIWKQVNRVAYNIAGTSYSQTSPHIFYNVPHVLYSVIMNEMH